MDAEVGVCWVSAGGLGPDYAYYGVSQKKAVVKADVKGKHACRRRRRNREKSRCIKRSHFNSRLSEPE